MDPGLFQSFCKIAHDSAGVHLKEGKESLVEARVAKRLRALGLSDARAYLSFLKQDHTGEELVNFLDVITTNFTSFLREPDHFELLADDFNQRIKEGQRRFRVWSAASSSGEEPYSMAITILDALGELEANLDLKILATDISTRVLDMARRGEYTDNALQRLSKRQRSTYFTRSKTSDKDIYCVKQILQKLIVFKRLNLSKPPFPMKGPFDVVFCRNVMIYFDGEVRQRLVSAIEQLVAPGGLLMIGHTETLTSVKSGFIALRPSIYRKPL